MRWERLIQIIAGIGGVYFLITASRLPSWLGYFLPMAQHRALSLMFALSLVYMIYRARRRNEAAAHGGGDAAGSSAAMPWYDWLVLGGGLAATGYVAFFYDRVLDYGFTGYLDLPGVILTVLLALSLLEGARRLTGWVLPGMILFFLLVTRFQNLLPGGLAGKGFALDRLGYAVYVGTGGVFGLPFGVASSVLIVFLIFGQLLEQAGAGRWFIDLALSLTGHRRGGPAKAAVVASGFFGMISGSPSANVATTGAFTIPLMKRVGYRPAFAGAVEAVASTGGQIMPPVMGAIAFVMAEWLGVSYSQVVLAAAIPAILYFIIVYLSVHYRALSRDIAPLSRAELPDIGATFRSGWFYLLPLVALMYLLLVRQWDPDIAGFYSLPVLVASSFLSPNRAAWLTPSRIWNGLQGAVRSWLTVAIITASVGMLVGSLELSGLGVKLSGFIVELGGGNLYLTLALVGLASLVMGMGLDSLPCYITLATLIAPALINLGVPNMAAHLYVVYWGLASFITPPVCIAVYVACGISQSKVWETGGEAVRLGIAAYLVSIAFALNPALLLRGSTGEIVLATVTAILGAAAVAAGVQGYALRPLGLMQRMVIIAGGLLWLGPGLYTGLIAAGLVAAVLLSQWLLPAPAVAGAPDRAAAGAAAGGGGSGRERDKH